MIAAAALALLLGQAQPAAPAPAEGAPVSPVIVQAAPAEPDPEQIAVGLAAVYEQSCGGRIYGQYAEVCNTLASQLAKAQAEARKAAARKAKMVKSAPAAPTGR